MADLLQNAIRYLTGHSTFYGDLFTHVGSLDINGSNAFDFVFSFEKELFDAYASCKNVPVDLKAIREKAMGKDVSKEDKFSCMVTLFWYVMVGPVAPKGDGNTDTLKHTFTCVRHTISRIGIRHKGEQRTRKDVTPPRLLSAFPEIAARAQAQVPASLQIQKMQSSLYPYSHPQVAALFDPDTTSLETINFTLWACAKTSAILQRNPDAGDQVVLKLMEEQRVYFNLAYGSTLVPAVLKERARRELGKDDVIRTHEPYTKFCRDNLAAMAEITIDIKHADESKA